MLNEVLVEKQLRATQQQVKDLQQEVETLKQNNARLRQWVKNAPCDEALIEETKRKFPQYSQICLYARTEKICSSSEMTAREGGDAFVHLVIEGPFVHKQFSGGTVREVFDQLDKVKEHKAV